MEPTLAPSAAGSVVLDIGGDVGAAIVHAPASLTGAELEIRRAGDPWEGRHVAVRARELPLGVINAALFDHLEQGRYQVRVRSGEAGPLLPFDVEGGRVTEVHFTP
jgi:hypothetical protein